jgi:hypothetical protein
MPRQQGKMPAKSELELTSLGHNFIISSLSTEKINKNIAKYGPD